MQYRNLGRSGVKVSTLCLGGMTFGEADSTSMMHGASSSQAEAFAVLDHAVAGGINFIDVASTSLSSTVSIRSHFRHCSGSGST